MSRGVSARAVTWGPKVVWWASQVSACPHQASAGRACRGVLGGSAGPGLQVLPVTSTGILQAQATLRSKGSWKVEGAGAGRRGED